MQVLDSGAGKTFEKAEQLFHETEMLAKAGVVSRALYLHQISLEECSNVDTLGACAVSLSSAWRSTRRRYQAAMAKHSSKNKSYDIGSQGPR